MPVVIYSDTTQESIVSRTTAQTITGAKIFQAGAATNIPIIVQAAPSQTANMQEWRYSTNNIGAAIASNGSLRIFGPTNAQGVDASAWLNVSINSAGDKGFVIRGAASQSGNLQEWQSNTGTVLGQITSIGRYAQGGVIGAEMDLVIPTNNTGMIIRGASNQSVNLQEWRNSANAIIAYNNNLGRFMSDTYYTQRGGGVSYFTSQDGQPGIHVVANATNQPAILAKSMAAATADIAQFNNSAGTAMARISPAGHVGASMFANAGTIGDQFTHKGLVQPHYGIGFGNNASGLSIGISGYGGVDVFTTGSVRLAILGDGSTTIYKSLSVEGFGPDNTTLSIGSTANGSVTASYSAHVRFRGDGVRHGELTWHPLESAYRMRSTSGTFMEAYADLWIRTLTQFSKAEGKTEVQTLQMSPSQSLTRGAATSKSISQRVMELRPVSYKDTTDPTGKTMYSFVAEEALEIMPEIVTLDGGGGVAGVNVGAMATIALALVSELTKRVESLEEELRSK